MSTRAESADAVLDIEEQPQDELFKVLTQSRSILWHAQIFERVGYSPQESCRPGRFAWHTSVQHEWAAQQVFPLDVPKGMSYHEVWLRSRHPVDCARIAEISSNALHEGLSEYCVEFRCYDRHGRERWFEEHVQLERMCHDRWQALGTCTDVTDRRLVQQASQEMGRRHRMIIGQIPDAVYLADAETGRLIESNPAFQRLLGYSAEEVLRLTLFDFVMAPREDIADRIARASETGVCPCGERLYRCRDGRLIEVEPNMSSLEQNGRKILCVVARDITERKAAEAQILAYQQQLCAAAAELSLAEERERRRIALSLHDGMGQLLAVARMKLDSLTNYADKTRIDEVLPEVQKLLAESIRMTRSLTSELSPPILYEQGLEPALEWLAKAVEKEHHLEVSFVNDDKPKTVPEDIRILLFRATRELLFNVVKHAKAHSACIAINRSEKNELCLSVLDDGIGYEVDGDPTLNGRAHGYGLFSIHDRLRRIGGQITIDSTPGNGTCVSLEVPLNTETRSNR